MNNLVYENRAVLFIDILGFSELVKAGRESEIIEALNMTEDIKKRYPFDNSGVMEISSFSDSIIVSANVDDGFGVVRIVHYAAHLAWKFLGLGILTRGGVSVGNMHHKNGIVFGPALLEAHYLESKLAIYPRILVSNHIFEKFIQYEAENRPQTLNLMRTLFREDFDVQMHINLMSDWCPSPPGQFMKKYHKNIDGGLSYTAQDLMSARKDCVSAALFKNASNDRNHLIKLGWLKRYVESYGNG